MQLDYEYKDCTAFKKGAIAAHRRSGSHLFLKILREYRSKYNLSDYRIRHLEADNQYAGYIYPQDLSEVVHIVRDGRDVLVSCWKYYKTVERFNGIDLKSFREFLYGKAWIGQEDLITRACMWEIHNCVPKHESDQQNWDIQMFHSPIHYWVRFVSGWANKALNVKFDDLAKIGKSFNLEKIGPNPGKGVSGTWREYMTAKDNDFFWSIAGDACRYFGFEKT